jgi:hypothetical protein
VSIRPTSIPSLCFLPFLLVVDAIRSVKERETHFGKSGCGRRRVVDGRLGRNWTALGEVSQERYAVY